MALPLCRSLPPQTLRFSYQLDRVCFLRMRLGADPMTPMDHLAPKQVLDTEIWMNGSSGMRLFVRTTGFLDGVFIASSGNRIGRITVANYRGVFGEWITFALG